LRPEACRRFGKWNIPGNIPLFGPQVLSDNARQFFGAHLLQSLRQFQQHIQRIQAGKKSQLVGCVLGGQHIEHQLAADALPGLLHPALDQLSTL
jgi:hypothetical protein